MELREEIINVLKLHEHDLSDGYEHYCGDVDLELAKIADEIIKVIFEDTKK